MPNPASGNRPISHKWVVRNEVIHCRLVKNSVADRPASNPQRMLKNKRRPSGKNNAETLFTYIFPRIFFVPMMAFVIQHFIFSPFTPFSFLPTNFFDGFLGLALVSQDDGLDFFDQQ